MGRWLADGGYDKIAEKLFNELRCERSALTKRQRSANGSDRSYYGVGALAVLRRRAATVAACSLSS
jgi:hypothetical protein